MKTEIVDSKFANEFAAAIEVKFIENKKNCEIQTGVKRIKDGRVCSRRKSDSGRRIRIKAGFLSKKTLKKH